MRRFFTVYGNHFIGSETYSTLSRDFKGDFQFTPNYIMHLPRKIGHIMLLTHDKNKDEFDNEYANRCIRFIKENIHPGFFTFFAYGTVINTSDKQRVEKVKRAFINGSSINQEDSRIIIPGHIAAYTENRGFISHQPNIRKNITQEEILAIDVKKSIKENQKTSTYIVVLSEKCFQHSAMENKLSLIKKYGWAAKDESSLNSEEDNCATAIQKCFLLKKNRNTMNPIETLAILVNVGSKHLLNSEQENNVMALLEKSGLSRNLHEVGEYEQRWNGVEGSINIKP